MSAAILDAVEAFLSRFVVYPSEHARVAHTLWIAHTWRMDAWESTPRIAFLSPEPGSGKTRALEVTELLVPRPVLAVNCTSAFLFRRVSDPAGLPTVLYDEIDTVFGPRAKSENEDIRGLLNAGHRKGAVAGRCVVKGKQIETEELSAYCAAAMAGLDDLPDTLMSRSVVIRMRRRAPDEAVEPFRRREAEIEGIELSQALAQLAETIPEGVWPAMPAGIEDRNGRRLGGAARRRRCRWGRLAGAGACFGCFPCFPFYGGDTEPRDQAARRPPGDLRGAGAPSHLGDPRHSQRDGGIALGRSPRQAARRPQPGLAPRQVRREAAPGSRRHDHRQGLQPGRSPRSLAPLPSGECFG
jgi:hypothetical protein